MSIVKNITKRDERLESRERSYYLGKRLFFTLFLMGFMAFVILNFVFDGSEKTDVATAGILCVTVIWFLAYKLSAYRIQHIETIRYYKKL